MERREDRFPRAVVLVEGVSDQLTLEALARRRGRELGAEASRSCRSAAPRTSVAFLDLFGPRAADVVLAGLCDAAEVGDYRGALQRARLGSNLGTADMEGLGFFVCDVDLEDEMFRAADPAVVEEVFEAQGDLGSFRTFQGQPAWRGRPHAEQLRRFVGTRSGRKIQTGAMLVDAVDPARMPRPLDLVLTHV